MRQGDCRVHEGHSHQHGPKCGHRVVRHGDHVDDHSLPVSASNPHACTPTTTAGVTVVA